MNIHLEMHWPQWVYLTLVFISVLISCVKHGEPDEYHAGYAILNVLIVLPILYAGGFFGP